MRQLRPADEPSLRDYWAEMPQAHLFSIADLDQFGWSWGRLRYYGWFDGHDLVGYLMSYGLNAQWHYRDPALAPQVARQVQSLGIRTATGLERVVRPVVTLLGAPRLEREEPSRLCRLPPAAFRPEAKEGAPGEIRRAAVADIPALTALHLAAPDQFENPSGASRERMLRAALTDGWRRIYLACSPTGQVVAAAQTSAEGRELAVIGGVVTHPAWRGQGYGSAVTAHLCAALLAEGRQPYLFYSRTNGAAARAYEKVGFLPLERALIAQLRWDR